MVAIRIRDVVFSDIQAIIFDKDGTLEDSQTFLRNLGQKRSRLVDAQIPGAGESMLIAYGIEGERLDPAGLLAVGSRHENEIAAAAYIAETGRGWLESLETARNAFKEADRILKDTDAVPSPLFVGSLEVIEQLWKAGLKLGILSADTTARVQRFIDHYQLDRYIQMGMGVDRGPSKPDPSLFLQACQSLDVPPERALMVGDSPLDIDMARNAGAAGCIGICWGRPEAAHLEAADVVISQLDEIKIEA
ncbi:MAG: HAD family hydrolase [Cyanobacteriota bacterium]|nr:HAD family hydrolase [Cyanobacteriota bacterium]